VLVKEDIFKICKTLLLKNVIHQINLLFQQAEGLKLTQVMSDKTCIWILKVN